MDQLKGRMANARAFAASIMLAGIVATNAVGVQVEPAPPASPHPSGMPAGHSLESAFANPPDSTKPRCYWYWAYGNVSREGITHDLEAMKRIGIGEGYIGIIGGGATKALTEEWWGLIEHAIREGGRIGVDIGLFNCPGWSMSGGPWIKPEQAMRYVSQLETRVTGPRRFEGPLPKPKGDFQDLAVLAFPAPARDQDDAVKQGAKITRDPKSVVFEMPQPYAARSLAVYPVKQLTVKAEFQASDDGQKYRTLRAFDIDRRTNMGTLIGPMPLGPIVLAFPVVTSRYFKVTFSEPCEVGNVVLSSAARVQRYPEKQLGIMYPNPLPPFDFYTWPSQAEPESGDLVVQPGAVLDLSANMDKEGVLKWEAPAGDWVVMRAVLLPTGTKNGPAPPEATGLEVDKMNRVALRSHFEAYVGKLLARMPEKDRRAFKHVVTDSYERGSQNWTDGMATDFRNRYGYDPLPYLPVLGGRIVGSADQSDRFLWDLRRFVADRVSRDFVGGFRDLCHAHGLKLWLENYGHWGYPGEFLQYGGNADEISGEFWESGELGSIECRDAASAAHIYGKPVVWAEAFTSCGAPFRNTPASLKAREDWSYCEGINQFVLHVYIHQPWDERLPGVNAWGTEFHRNNPWFSQFSGPWIEYQRRCSAMLQAGNHVADVAYFITEDAPKMTGPRKPELPSGYNFDFINAEVIQERLSVKNGRLVLPDGMSYRLLVLPEQATMRPEFLRRIRDLVNAGGVVLGRAPVRSPSLQNYPACDAEVQALAAELWGAGRVLTNTHLKAAFDKLALPPDVVCPKNILWTHRRDGDTEIYFLANQSAASRTETISFRVEGKAPEFWWPETGRIERPAVYSVARGRVCVPVTFGPNTSVFVVFRDKARADRVEELSRDGTPIFTPNLSAGSSVEPAKQNNAPSRDGMVSGGALVDMTYGSDGMLAMVARAPGRYAWKTADGKTGTREVAAVPAPIGLAGPWEVSFADKGTVVFEALTDWTQRMEEWVKYYSGVATYRKRFEWKPGAGEAGAQRVYLDLGEVCSLARVRVNGREAGTLWKLPFRVEVTGMLKPGENRLEIEVVNTWLNRLVGDEQPGARKTTFTISKFWKADTKLLPAGLLGPVVLVGE